MGKYGTAQDGVTWIFKKVFGKTDDAAALKKSGISKWDELSQTPSFLDDYTLIAVRTTDDAATAKKLAGTRADTINRGVGILNGAKDIKLMGLVKWSGIAVIGYGTWRALNLVGVVSEAAEDTINNFFGINCEDGDTQCLERGAKNMVNTGLLVAAGIGGLVVLSLKKDSQEPVENDSQESVDAS